MKFLRYTEDGSITNNVEVLDWLTVSAQGDAKTKLQAIIQAFAYILEALEGMLQVCEVSLLSTSLVDRPTDRQWFRPSHGTSPQVSRSRLFGHTRCEALLK